MSLYIPINASILAHMGQASSFFFLTIPQLELYETRTLNCAYPGYRFTTMTLFQTHSSDAEQKTQSEFVLDPRQTWMQSF